MRVILQLNIMECNDVEYKLAKTGRCLRHFREVIRSKRLILDGLPYRFEIHLWHLEQLNLLSEVEKSLDKLLWVVHQF